MVDDLNVQIAHTERSRTRQEYLGDGVYAEFDGYQIWLYTHDGISRLSEIALEPGVFGRLLTYEAGLHPERPDDRDSKDQPITPPPTPYHSLCEAAMAATTQKEADDILEQLTNMHALETGDSRERALEIQRSNLGYFAGYYSAGTRARVEELFSCAHPFFGAIAEKGQPTAEEAFKMGMQFGQASRKQSE